MRIGVNSGTQFTEEIVSTAAEDMEVIFSCNCGTVTRDTAVHHLYHGLDIEFTSSSTGFKEIVDILLDLPPEQTVYRVNQVTGDVQRLRVRDALEQLTSDREYSLSAYANIITTDGEHWLL